MFWFWLITYLAAGLALLWVLSEHNYYGWPMKLFTVLLWPAGVLIGLWDTWQEGRRYSKSLKAPHGDVFVDYHDDDDFDSYMDAVVQDEEAQVEGDWELSDDEKRMMDEHTADKLRKPAAPWDD